MHLNLTKDILNFRTTKKIKTFLTTDFTGKGGYERR
jgi:hypothetical protein